MLGVAVRYVYQTSMPVKKNMDTTVQTKIFAHIIYKILLHRNNSLQI